MRILPLITALLTAASSSTAFAQNTAGDLSVIVFQSGKPVKNAQLTVGDDIIQLTNKIGSAHVIIPSGIHLVEVTYNKKTLASAELLTIAGENTQIIVSVPAPGKQADIDIETSDIDTPTDTNLSDGQTEDQGQGALSGQIVSLENQKTLAGAKIYISGTRVDLVSDENGRFNVELPVGVYSLSVILPGYASVTLDGVEINKNLTTQKNIELSPAGLELSEFVVLVPYIEGSVASIVEETRNSSEVKEVLGAEQMSQAGDSNAAGALARVTGLTIEDGKYVVIRGQPSRYTLSMLNGSPLPSPDPIRRVVPLDLFPTDVLTGIEVQKTFSADKPGDFGGGLVDLSTRGIPETPFISFSLGSAYNTVSTGEDAPTYQGGSDDYLGIDDGTRAIPDEVIATTENGTKNLNLISEDERNALGKRFPNNYEVTTAKLGPDKSLALTGGSRIETGFGEFGFLGSISWGQKYRLTEELNRDFNVISKDRIEVLNEFNKTQSDMNVNLGYLFVVGGKWDNHELTGNHFFIRDTIKRTSIEEGENNTSDPRYERNFSLEWNHREMQVNQLLGKHDFDFAQLDWRLLKADGNRESPDRRTYTYIRVPSSDDFIFYEESGGKRRYNSVQDNIDSLGIDLTIPIVEKDTVTASIKTGFATYEQDRISETSRYRFEPEGNLIDLSLQNPEDILSPENIGNGLSFNDDSQPDYSGSANVQAQYLMADLSFNKTLRLLVGARQETADFEVKTVDKSAIDAQPIVGGFDDSHLLPAVTGTWFLRDDMQLRLGYSKTVSRPVLVELSNTLFFDPDSSDVYRGNPDLKPAVIDGADMRWEWYFSSEEMLSIGAFWRGYTDPIERSFEARAGGLPQITFENAESATVIGLETGGRLSLDHFIEGIYFQSNITLLDSSVTLKDADIATNESRPLQGQAEYVFNAQLGYDGEKHDWALAFNQVGKRLDKAGVNGVPDIYREPVPSLNAKWSWKINQHTKFSFAAQNILDPTFKYVGGGLVEKSFNKGITLKTSISIEY